MRRLFLTCFVLILPFGFGCDAPKESTDDSKPDAETVAVAPKTETADESKTFLTVDTYDPNRDAVADLEMTKTLAAKSNKRILLEVGGKW